MAPFEELYGRSCRSPVCWAEEGDKTLLGPEFVRETTEKVALIRERLRVAQSRQKSCADRRRRSLKFEVSSHVFLRVSPKKGLIRFSRGGGKLAPRYIGPFEVLGRFGAVAYRLALPPQLGNVHNMFHMFQSRVYHADPSHVIQ